MSNFAYNPDTGDAVYLDPETQAWVPAQKAVNPETNDTLFFDGQGWRGVEMTPTPGVTDVRPGQPEADNSLLAGAQSAPAMPSGVVPDSEVGTFDKYVANPAGRGWNTLQQYGAIAGNMLGMMTPEEMAVSIAEDEAHKKAYPTTDDVYAGTQEIMSTEGFWDTVAALARNPEAITNVTMESLVTSTPSLALGAAGALGGSAAGPVGTVIGAGTGAATGSFGTEAMNSYIEEMTERGVDVSNPETIKAIWADEGFQAAAAERALKRGVPIAIMDGLSAGMAGKAYKAVKGTVDIATSKPARIAKSVAGGGAEAVAQSTAGALGEAGAQLNYEGEISSPGAVGLEAAAELGPGAVETATGVLGERRAIRKQEEREQKAAQREALTNTDPNSYKAGAQEAGERIEPEAPKVPSAPAKTPETGAVSSVIQGDDEAARQTGEQAPAASPASEPETPAPQAQETPSQEGGGGRSEVVTPNNSMTVEVEEQVVELDDLITSDDKRFPGELQPRDRDTGKSDQQVSKIVSSFDPEQVASSRTSDTGAPIVSSDGVVESGNGRVMSIRRLYQDNPEGAQRYRDFLAKRGIDVSKMKNPVLVRRRKTDLDQAGRIKFAQDSNADNKLRMDASEQAAQDAQRITPEIVSMWRGGSAADLKNSDFRKAFIEQVAGGAANAGGMIDKQGNVSADGVRRIQAALMQYAYGNNKMVENVFNQADEDLKSVGRALTEAAPAIAAVQSKIKQGQIDKQYDLGPKLREALGIIQDIRDTGRNIEEALNQSDFFGGDMDPVVEKIIRGIYAPGLGRIASGKALNEFFNGYANAVNNFDPNQGDMLGGGSLDNVDVILDKLLDARKKKGDDQGDLLNQPKPTKKAASKSKDTLVDSAPKEGAKESPQGKPKAPKEGAKKSPQEKPKAPKEGAKKSPQGKPKAPKSKAQELAETEGRQTIDYSISGRTSKFRSLFVAAGLDPDKAVNLPPRRQLQIAKKVMQDKYKLRIEIGPGMTDRVALDQLLDMYHNFQWLTHVLGIPEGSLNLRRTVPVDQNNNTAEVDLTLLLRKNAPYFGAFYPGKNVVAIPDRSNSFAHEWMHVLDFYMLEAMDLDKSFVGYSDAIRKEGDDYTPSTVSGAWVNLMNTIFFDKAGHAAEIMNLERKIERAKSEKVKEKYRKEIEELKRGSSQKRTIRSNYYNEARAQGEYWKKPTEMIARAFEAYVAAKIEMHGGSTEALAKGDKAYLSNADERLQTTFPKQAERDAIFKAFDDMFDAMRAAYVLNSGELDPAAKPKPDLDMLEPSALDRAGVTSKLPKGVKAKIDAIIRKEVQAMKRQNKERLKQKARPKDSQPILRRMNTARALAFSSVRATFRMLESRYPNSSAVRKIANKLVTAPGERRAVGEIYEEARDRVIGKYLNRLRNALKSNGLENMSDADAKLLRMALLGRNADGKITKANVDNGIPANINRAAAQIRKAILDDLWYHNKNAGVKLGFVKDTAYLPRLIDTPKILADNDGFIEAATEVYGILFDQRLAGAENYYQEVVNIAAKLDIQSKDKLDAFKSLVKQIAKEEDADKIDELTKDAQDILDDGLLDEIREAYGEEAANDWLSRIMNPNSDFDSKSPSGDYTKTRVLPPEADVLMEKFYVADPIEAVSNYIFSSARRSEYVRRFGADNETLDSMAKEMAEQGVDPRDIELIKELVFNIAGKTQQGKIAKKFLGPMNFIHTIGTIMLLPRAVIASLMEPITAGIRTGDVRDSFKAMGMIMSEAFQTADAKERAEIAAMIGAVTDDMTEAMLMNQFGGTFDTDPRNHSVLAKFFRRTFLTPLTNAQRRSAIGVSVNYISYLARSLNDDKTSKRKMNDMTAEMAELGIGKDDIDGFTSWVTSQDNLLQALGGDSPYAKMLVVAVSRMQGQAIQNPRVGDRPLLANNPVGRVAYSIMSFTYSFYENVMKRTAKYLDRTRKDGGNLAMSIAVARFAAPFAVLYMGQAIVGAARVALFSPDRWEEWEDNDELIGNLLKRGVTASGFYGPLDPIYNTFAGIKYQRDIANVFVGAHMSYFLQAMQRIGQYFVNNSENTNTAERNATRGIYELFISPAIAYALASAPGGPALGGLFGLASMATTSSGVAQEFGEFFFPEEDKSGPKPPKIRPPKVEPPKP